MMKRFILFFLILVLTSVLLNADEMVDVKYTSDNDIVYKNSPVYAQVKKASAMMDNGDIKGAIDILQKSLKNEKLDAESKALIYVGLGAAYERMGDSDNAAKYYTIVNNQYKNTNAKKMLSERNNRNITIDSIQKCIKEGNKELAIRQAKEFIFHSNDVILQAQAIELIEKAYPNVNVFDLYSAFINKLIIAKKLNQANKVLNDYLRVNPGIKDGSNYIILRSQLNQAMGNGQQSEKDLLSMIDRVHNDNNLTDLDTMIMYSKIVSYYVQKLDYKKALAYLDEALQTKAASNVKYIADKMKKDRDKYYKILNYPANIPMPDDYLSSDSQQKSSFTYNKYTYVILTSLLLIILLVIFRIKKQSKNNIKN